MGWHIGMTAEEMAEFAGMSCSKADAKKAAAAAPAPKYEGSSSQEFEDSISNDSPPIKDIIVETETAPTAASDNTACPLPPDGLPPPPPPEVDYIYHLCQRSKWEEAVNAKLPYFPPTYMKDGKFTRASVRKEDIVGVANIFYKDTPGKWIVLEVDCQLLYSLGIPILAQEAPESKLTGQPVKCLQIFGGISTSLPLIHKIYPVFRKSANGEFVKLLDPVPAAAKTEEAAAPARKASKPPKPAKKENIKVTDTPEQPKSKDRKKKGLLGKLKKGVAGTSSRKLKV